MELFNMELKAMNEMAQDDDLIHTDARTRVIITQYFHDLYRFYKLHPLKNEFDDVFNLPVRSMRPGSSKIGLMTSTCSEISGNSILKKIIIRMPGRSLCRLR